VTANEQQQIGALTAEVANLKDEVKALKGTLQEVRDTLVSVEGGWKFLVSLSAIVGAVIGFAMQFLPFLPHKG
jgi:hypothetical protein